MAASYKFQELAGVRVGLEHGDSRELEGVGMVLPAVRAERRHGEREHVEVAFASLKREFRLGGTLAKTFVGLSTRVGRR